MLTPNSAPLAGRLVTDQAASRLWVAPMNHINFGTLQGLLRKRPTCSRVVAFQPTGWTHKDDSAKTAKVSKAAGTSGGGCGDTGGVTGGTGELEDGGDEFEDECDGLMHSTGSAAHKPCPSVIGGDGGSGGGSSSHNNVAALRPRVKGNITIYSVPYSEHSSFGELVQCIRTFR